MTASTLHPCAPAPPDSPRAAGPAPIETLDDEGLLARLLRRSLGAATADRLAPRLLGRFGGLGEVAAAPAAELRRLPGLGEGAVEDLGLLRALSLRLAREAARRGPVLSSSSAVLDYLRVALAHLPREQFRVLYLNRRNLLLADELVADGTVDHAPVYPREVVRMALELSASSMILAHNHPSGDPTPSAADVEMTRQVVRAAAALGLEVHDHLVVGREGSASFRALGLI